MLESFLDHVVVQIKHLTCDGVVFVTKALHVNDALTVRSFRYSVVCPLSARESPQRGPLISWDWRVFLAREKTEEWGDIAEL